MRTLLTRLRGFYGEHPLHLLVLLACFALAGYSAMHVATDRQWPWMLLWFAAAVIGHDLVLFPVYALLDVSATSVLGVLRRHRRAGAPPRVPVLNYLRIPVLGTALTLVVFLPGIIRQGALTYHAATGLTQQPFLARWLLLCAAMFAVSAVVYAIRLYASGVAVRAALAPVRAMLGRGERILVVAAGPTGPVGAVASSAALYHPAADRPGVFLRTAWHDLADVEWRAEDSSLVLVPAAESHDSPPVRLVAPGELMRVAKELIAATPSPAGRRPVLGPVVAGALAGLASAAVVGAVTAYHGMVSTAGNAAIGLAGYGIQAAVVGIAVGLTVARERIGPAVVVSGGVLLGGLGWVLFPLSLAPLAHGHSPTWSVAAAVASFPDLVRDVLHGGLTGVLVSVAAGHGWIRPLTPRLRRQRHSARVVIVGGGFAGVSAARRFERLAVRGAPIDVTVVSDSNFLLFTPMLAEAAAGALEGRHISAPVRSAVAHTRFRYGTVRRIDVQQRVVELHGAAGGNRELQYDHLVLACGSVPHTLGLPGLDAHSWTLKDLTDAQRLRDHVLELLERTEHEPDPRRRAEALTFVVAGAGFAGTEMVAELFDLVHGVGRFYPAINPAEARFVLVHAGDRILPEMSPALAGYAHGRLSARGIDLRLGVRVTEAARDGVRLSDGAWIPSRTLVWTAGNRPGPLADQLAATAGQSRLTTDPALRVVGMDRVWAAGDCARIPDPDHADASYPPTAQHAIREGRAVADNIAAVLSGRQPVPFRFRTIGVLVALGRHTAVADLRGHHFAGLAAWLLWRGVYLSKLPGLEKRVRVLLDWLLDLAFSRDIVVTTPREVAEAPETAGSDR